ncbi:hypothetical protein [Nocardia brasiliensis]
MGMDNAGVVAAVLGYSSAAALGGQEAAARAYRLAYVLDIPIQGAEGLMILDRVLELFLAEPQVPDSGDARALQDQTHEIAARCVPIEDELCQAIAETFGRGDDPDPAQAVYQVCSRAARFLAKSVMIARGDTDRLFEEPADAPDSLIGVGDMQRLVEREVAKGVPVEAVLSTINDMHHYEFTFPGDTYVEDVAQACAELTGQGHVLIAVGAADLHEDPSGAGLNVCWSVPEGGRGLEVRFRVRDDGGRAARQLSEGWVPVPAPAPGTEVHVDSHLFVLRGQANLRGGRTTVRAAQTHSAFGNAVLLEVADHPGYLHNWHALESEQARLATQFGAQAARPDPEEASIAP